MRTIRVESDAFVAASDIWMAVDFGFAKAALGIADHVTDPKQRLLALIALTDAHGDVVNSIVQKLNKGEETGS